MMKRAALTLTCCALFGLLSASLQAEPTVYFRHDDGVAADDGTPLPDDFGSRNQRVWRQELPPGHSTPCIAGDSLFLTTYRDDEQELATVAVDRHSGEIRWRHVVPAETIEPYHPVGSPASSSPACDGERLYVFFGSYGLLCYDLDGELLWEKRMGPFQNEFGASSSPILVDGKVILNEDHDIDSFLVAFDKLTGEQIWKVPREGFTRSFSTPVVWETDGEKQLIVAGALKLIAYDLETGQQRWWIDGLSRIVDTTPVRANGLLHIASWTPGGDQTSRISMEPFAEAAEQYDKNGDGKIGKDELPQGPVLQRFFRIDLNQDKALDATEWAKHARVFELAENVAMAIRPGGRGNVSSTHVAWKFRKGLPTVPSPVAYRGILYMVKDSGIITSLDVVTGELLKQGRAAGRGNYYASPVAGDGKVYLASEQGVVTVLSAGRDWDILSYHDFGERIMSTPVFHDGRMYVRTEESLYCFQKR